MTSEELHGLELELRTIIERIDAIRTIARDLKLMPKLSAEDTTGLDKLEETLKDPLKKRRRLKLSAIHLRRDRQHDSFCSYGVSDCGASVRFNDAFCRYVRRGSLILLCATHGAMCEPPSNAGSTSPADVSSTAPDEKDRRKDQETGN